ncbi:hypothetical protein Hanom_Chr04g00295831 [Helianthus anomalus]
MQVYISLYFKYAFKFYLMSLSIRPCVVEEEYNAPTLGHFTPCGGPVSKGALLGVF